eukprot:m.91670 g.91670  ORF g.91670 m.91670 type:complete len:358 (+) comp14640_c0_seq7:162-1235(+)
MSTCRCGVFTDGRVEIQEIPIPELTGTPKGTVLIKTIYTTICGSDLLYIKHSRPIDACHGTSVHEAVGELVDIHGMTFQETSFAKGDLVLAMPSNYMESGIYRAVDETLKEDLHRIPLTGGLSEYFLSHISHIFKLPPPTPELPTFYFTAAQPLGTLLWLARKLPNLLFKDVVVYGTGQNGCLLIPLLSNMGARRIIAVDLVPERLEAAKAMKATHTILGGDIHEVARQVCAITNGGADFVFEMVGHQEETLAECVQLPRDGGTIVAFGVPCQDHYTKFPFSAMFRRNLTLMTSVFPVAAEDFAFAVELIAQQRIDPGPLFRSPWYRLENADTAFTDCAQHKDRVLKVIIDMITPRT